MIHTTDIDPIESVGIQLTLPDLNYYKNITSMILAQNIQPFVRHDPH